MKVGGVSRRGELEPLAKAAVGTFEAVYFAFGEDDAVVIADVPDQETMTAVLLTAGATGAVNLKTTVLITPEEVDEAIKKTVEYRPPGA